MKLFKPLKVNKKHFTELTREARIVRLEPGEAYAVEDVTPADERLSILLKGKYVVFTFLAPSFYALIGFQIF